MLPLPGTQQDFTTAHSRILVKLLICISPRNAGVGLLNIPLMNARLEPKSGLKVLKRKDSKAILALVLLSASERKKAIC